MDTPGIITIDVFRFEPTMDQSSYFQKFEIQSEVPMSIMEVLMEIHMVDTSFACRTSLCHKGRCGVCQVRVNGKDVLGCITMVEPGTSTRIEPHSGFHLIRDSVVDFSAPVILNKDTQKL